MWWQENIACRCRRRELWDELNENLKLDFMFLLSEMR